MSGEHNPGADTTTNPGASTTTLAAIDWDDAGQPLSSTFGDIYFSRESGLEESDYVFLRGNQLRERWQSHRAPTFTIAETGFGSGLNFLLAWRLWRQLHCGGRLHFLSCEKFPMSRGQLQRALSLWPALSEFATDLLKAYPPQPFSGFQRMLFDGGAVSLTVYFGEAGEAYDLWSPTTDDSSAVARLFAEHPCTPRVDAWFLDGFAPAKNPAMWSDTLFNAMARLSKSGTTVATFTAAGQVRRALLARGFTCRKIPGYGRKREMLVAEYTSEALQAATEREARVRAEDTWQLLPPGAAPAHCVVIGGGLAGCHAAFALARRGIRVTLLERRPTLAGEASGNPQGVLYARLSPHADPLSRWNLSALCFALRFYHHFDFFAACGEACGVLYLATSPRERQHYAAIADRFAEDPAFCRWLSADACLSHSGLRSTHEALWLPQAGWLSPAALCQALCATAGVEVRTGVQVGRITTSETSCQLWDTCGMPLLEADAVVMANAHDALQLRQSRHLPLKRIRGQISELGGLSRRPPLRSVICGDGYVAPWHEGHMSCGASFNLDSDDSGLQARDHRDNLARLSALSEDFAPLVFEASAETLPGRVGFRCTTPDYLPLVGPLADVAATEARFAPWRHRAKTRIDHCGAHQPNVYTLLGLGSRGLSYAPLAAEVLACVICREYLPIAPDLYRHLHPARFQIRSLRRNEAPLQGGAGELHLNS